MTHLPCRRCQAFPVVTVIAVRGEPTARSRNRIACPQGHDWAIAESLAQASEIWRRAQLGEDRRGDGVLVG